MTPLPELPTFVAPDIAMERRDDGSIRLWPRQVPPDCERSIAAVLARRAAEHPDHPLAAERGAEDRWITLTYGDAQRMAQAVARAFLDLGLGPDRPVMILSGNSLHHLAVSLGAYAAGVPVMPISVAYSLMSADHARIRAIAELTRPGLVFADDAGPFAEALDALAATVSRVLVARGDRDGALRLDDLLGAPAAPAEAVSGDGPTPDTVAKLLFTSGSTGVPKGVVNTHRMLCSNQAMLQAIWPFLADERPVLVDWLPWSHTFGANHNLNLALFNGGTIHIDDGKPAPPLFHRTISALKDIPPTLYFNVPAGYALLAPALETDPELAQRFFSRLRFMFYAAAALPDALAVRLRRLARGHADHEVPLTSSWGTTETAPCATSMHFLGAPTGCIGVPIPGCSVKLAPVGDRLEIRVKGPNVTPGYFRAPELTAEAFDKDGFYRSGDAVKLIDESDPNRGMLFDGRIAENFKLLTGTFVAVGALRTRLLSAATVLSDAVICGHDGEYVAAMAWVNQAEARKLTGATDDLALDDARLRAHLADALRALNQNAGSASRIERLLLLTEAPSLDAGEVTDKGYLNQRRTIERRAADVARLYADPPDAAVISAGDAQGQ
ncbi:MAG TPA: feruloyl-CoA synthase [Solirubrobacteraceae bacterium]|jgi:feruloyl-CoA synthase|nr:feruloyl-CoA synthase [Solirubrobacteraceae bacterium]